MDAPDLRAELQRLFGFSSFLPGQEEIVRSALDGRDTLALMPTGSGKSLPYQLAAMLRPSPTLVVSPLIALMKDQLDKLPQAVAARASAINSSLEAGEGARRLAALASGEVKLLLAAPERLRRASFVEALRGAGIGLVVIDEVHCVSMWGHDFRPDYLFLRTALERLGDPPVLGLTATATPETERSIGEALGRRLEVVRASVVRANLAHRIEEVEDEEGRKRALLAQLRATDGPAIVYARARKKCEQVTRFLRGHGVDAVAYHAGLPPAERTAAQEAFLQGRVRVVVATTAFGMGIDKPDIRLVLLYNLPGSLEDYVQMVGRAGRDGAPSDCVLFSGDRDAADLRRFAQADAPTLPALRSVYRELRARAREGGAEAEAEELAAACALEERHDVRVLVGMLEQAGLVRRGFDAGRSMRVELLDPPADAPERMAALLERYRRQAFARASRIVEYAESQRCRQAQIAEHFGEAEAESCERCDRCTRSGVVAFVDDEPAARLPDDVGAAILETVRDLRWPLGVSGLVAMLGGSVAAPPSARRHPAFGVLAAARPGTIKRWVGRLLGSGHLEQWENEKGFKLLRVGRGGPLPRLDGRAARAADDEAAIDVPGPLFERLRAWRSETAREAAVPAYVVLPDRALRALAVAQPADADALLDVPGIGPAKLERYGGEILAVIGGSQG